MFSPEIAVSSSMAVGNSTCSTNNQEDDLHGKVSVGGGGRCRGGKHTAGSSTTKSLPIPPSSRCPRCDSPNTKFCYYNNYSLAQPRHFCKTCRRYWTKGGALRNVPIGGGCRKSNKSKSKSSSANSTSSSSVDYSSKDYSATSYLFSDNIPGSGGSGFLLNPSLFHGLNSPSSSLGLGICHQNDQLSGRIPFALLNSSTTTGTTTSCFDIDGTAGSLLNMGSLSYNDNLAGNSSTPAFRRDQQELCSSMMMNGYQGDNQLNHLTSSIESLSNMNQELHWKLQQQRLAMLYGVRNNQYSNTSFNTTAEVSGLSIQNQLQHAEKLPLPISFQNLEISKQEAAGAVSIDQIVGLKRGDDSINYNNAQATADQWSIFDKYNNSITNNNSTPINTITAGANEKVIGSWKDVQAWTTTTTDHQHFAPLL